MGEPSRNTRGAFGAFVFVEFGNFTNALRLATLMLMKVDSKLGMMLVFLSGFLVHCGGKTCTQKACLEAVRFIMLDPLGQRVRVFEGSITVDNATYEFACNTAYPREEGPVQCADGAIWLAGMATFDKTYFVTVISDVNGYHAKLVEPDYGLDTDFNGPNCGECAFGIAELVLTE